MCALSGQQPTRATGQGQFSGVCQVVIDQEPRVPGQLKSLSTRTCVFSITLPARRIVRAVLESVERTYRTCPHWDAKSRTPPLLHIPTRLAWDVDLGRKKANPASASRKNFPSYVLGERSPSLRTGYKLSGPCSKIISNARSVLMEGNERVCVGGGGWKVLKAFLTYNQNVITQLGEGSLDD
ncbi:hypothetical protein RRG08_026616 [Elysia crispata]|uniref:Uncharacterized protein n=1 Tax=Elysia crispata TaxID=231223 RepID=A0AAE1AYE9_9GAST|nr:hypothetical protein RRG08_026616 [Elysia crispata]